MQKSPPWLDYYNEVQNRQKEYLVKTNAIRISFLQGQKLRGTPHEVDYIRGNKPSQVLRAGCAKYPRPVSHKEWVKTPRLQDKKIGSLLERRRTISESEYVQGNSVMHSLQSNKANILCHEFQIEPCIKPRTLPPIVKGKGKRQITELLDLTRNKTDYEPFETIAKRNHIDLQKILREKTETETAYHHVEDRFQLPLERKLMDVTPVIIKERLDDSHACPARYRQIGALDTGDDTSEIKDLFIPHDAWKLRRCRHEVQKKFH